MWGALTGPEKSPPSGPWLGGGYSWKRCHYLMIFCPQVFVKAGSIPRWWWLRWCSAPVAAAEAAWRLVARDSRAPLVSSLVSGCSSSSPLGSIASAPRPAVGGRWSLGLSLSLSRGASAAARPARPSRRCLGVLSQSSVGSGAARGPAPLSGSATIRMTGVI